MKIQPALVPVKSVLNIKNVVKTDAEVLGCLMDRAYRDTIDYEGESLEQFIKEIEETIDGKYGPLIDYASFWIEDKCKAISASVLTMWKQKPLLTFSMTDPDFQKRGLARALIERSLNALAENDVRELFLVVTDGNPARRLYESVGFKFLGESIPKTAPPPE